MWIECLLSIEEIDFECILIAVVVVVVVVVGILVNI